MIHVKFKDRAMFEFVSLLEKTRERAIYMRRQAQSDEEEEGLRKSMIRYSRSARSSDGR